MTEGRIDFLFRYLRSRGVDPTDVDDIVQEVLLAVFLGQPDFSRQHIEALTLLSTITRRTATKHRERAYQRRELTASESMEAVVDDAPDPEQHAIAESRKRFLHDLLDKLTPDQIRVIVAHTMLDMTFEEIAAELEMPLGTVCNHHRVGMEVLHGSRKRWQARQARLGLNLTPIVLAPFLMVRRAWAASARAVRGSLRAKVLAVATVIGLVFWSTGSSRQDQATITARGLAPARIDATAVALAAAGEEPIPASISLPSAPSDPASPGLPSARPRDYASAEKKLMLRARAAMGARAYPAARHLLERHARMFPRGQFAGERQALLVQLRNLSAGTAAPAPSTYQ